MPRTRAKSPPRLTRDAERLIALSNGLNASGSVTEDRFWEAEMSALVARLLENSNDAPIDGALDHLYQTNLGAYDTLIELVENESESVAVMQADRAWQALLIAAPIVAWSKYSIPSGGIARDDAETLKVHLQAHVLADGARLALVPYLYSIDQLPRHYSELRKLAARLADVAVSGEVPRLDLARLPDTAHLLADTRFLVACAAVPRGSALFRWQEDASGHAGRAGSLEQWISQARPTLSRLLPGCVFECLLPDAYYVNCRESDRRVRPLASAPRLPSWRTRWQPSPRTCRRWWRASARSGSTSIASPSRSSARPTWPTASSGRCTGARTRTHGPARSTR
jgi:hypothetical protein